MKTVNRTKLLLLLLAAAVVVLAGKYAWPHMQSLTGQADTVRQETADLTSRADAADRVRADQAHYDQLRDGLTAAIPAGPQVNDVIDRLQAMCHAAGVTWISGVPQKSAVASGGTPTWTVVMSLTGQAAGVSRLLDELHDNARLFVVDNFSLTSNDGVTVNASAGLRIFATGTGGTK